MEYLVCLLSRQLFLGFFTLLIGRVFGVEALTPLKAVGVVTRQVVNELSA
jgi:hypothetical protein